MSKMKLIMESWREFLNEADEEKNKTAGNVVAQGIIAAKLDNKGFLIKQRDEFVKNNSEYTKVPDDKLHITLLHQNLGKQLKANGVAFADLSNSKIAKEIRTYKFPNIETVTFEKDIYVAEAGGKKSVYVKVDSSSNKKLETFIAKHFVEQYNQKNPDKKITPAQFEEARNTLEKGERIFHVSLANTGSGKPGESVALVHVEGVSKKL
tara:strand:+ start:311 stop:934 length:624 start_codon:yes stop_codon:yes gene_type:complete